MDLFPDVSSALSAKRREGRSALGHGGVAHVPKLRLPESEKWVVLATGHEQSRLLSAPLLKV